MFSRCRVCLEKDNRISDLQAQIEILKKLAFPAHSSEPSAHELEMNKLLDGSDMPFEPPKGDPVELEMHKLLMGSYSDDVELVE